MRTFLEAGVDDKFSRSKLLLIRKKEARKIDFSFSPKDVVDELKHFWPAPIWKTGSVMKGAVENIKVTITDFTTKNDEERAALSRSFSFS